MAQVRPSKLEDDILKDPFRGVERRFFQLCHSLPDEWFALYGVTWIDKNANGGATEGEADFVFIGPEIGLVVVEIKGGRVGRDNTGWYTIDRNDQRHEIKDPALQARKNKHRFVKMITRHPKFQSRFIPAAYMVCFPNTAVADLPQTPDLPRELQICYDDYSNLQSSIYAAAKYSNPPNRHLLLNAQDCREIADILKPNFEMPGRWSVIAKIQRDFIEHLTSQQQKVLSMVEGNRMIGLTGPAGSGKTVVALRWASDQVRQGRSVLSILPTALLEEYFRAILPVSDKSGYMRHSLVIEHLPVTHQLWETIIIDEAQDLTIDHWKAIESYLSVNPTASLVAIYDSNQRIRARQEFYLPQGITEVRLSEIIRNTRQIAQISSLFYRNEKRHPSIVGPEGFDVQEIPLERDEDLPLLISKFILHMVRDEGFDYNDIVVLLGKKADWVAEHYKDPYGGISYRAVADWWEFGHKHPIISYGNISKFRGLESPVVVLADIEDLIEKDLIEACYIGVSRARHVLAIVASKDTLERIKQGGIVTPTNNSSSKPTIMAFIDTQFRVGFFRHQYDIGYCIEDEVTKEKFQCRVNESGDRKTIKLLADRMYGGEEVKVLYRTSHKDGMNIALEVKPT